MKRKHNRMTSLIPALIACGALTAVGGGFTGMAGGGCGVEDVGEENLAATEQLVSSCGDQSPWCPYWTGWCTESVYSEWLQEFCPVSCNSCPEYPPVVL